MSNRRRQFPSRPEPYPQDRLKVNSLDTLPEPKERTPLELFWDELDQEEEQEGEGDALQKRDPEGSGEEEPKLCWACNRAGQVKGNCPELRDLDKSKAQRPGDD